LEKSAICVSKHNFDRAKSGYFNFLLKNQTILRGDHPTQIDARRNFLSKDFYLPLANQVNRMIASHKPSSLIDAGCGEGYYTHAIKKDNPTCKVYGFDISKEAVEKAAKQNREIHYCVSSVNRLPYRNNSSDMITSLFAPIDEVEFLRVLRVNGILLVISAHPQHLLELKEVAYDTIVKHEHTSLSNAKLKLLNFEEFSFTLNLTQPDITNLFNMTPYGFRTSAKGKERVEAKENLAVTAKFIIETYQKI
jgi:23S rRNA (guanine745-N1)-methyltransferase